MAFSRGERTNRVELVRIEDTPLETYRYTPWDAFSILDDITRVSIEAQADYAHIWISSEQFQVVAAATWLASARRTIGDTLTSSADSKGRIPRDVVEVATTNYYNAQTWYSYRDHMHYDENFVLDNPTALNDALSWPQPGANLISQELFTCAKTIADYLVAMSLPTVLGAIDGSSASVPEYARYSQRIYNEAKHIQQRLEYLTAQWNERLNPNVEPGAQLYRDTTALIEEIIGFGVHALVPVTGDRFYKLPPRKKTPPNATNAFAPDTVRIAHMAPLAITDSPAFNPADRPRRAGIDIPPPPEPTTAESFNPKKYTDRGIQPAGTPFDPRSLRPEIPKEVQTSESFDPSAHRPPKDGDEPSPPFDPTDHRRTK